MEQKKRLRINCAMCDISAAAESTLASYESISINAAVILTSASTQALVPKYHVVMNAASVLTVPEGVELKVINGKHTLLPGETPPKPVALMVNGVLEIGKDAGEVLSHYALIQVNGAVTYPDTLAGKLDMLRVNGSSESYPADAVLLKPAFVVDKAFCLRAKAGKYYARRRIVLLGDRADADALAAKGVRFQTKTAVLAESLAEAALPLFGEDTEIHLIPDGCAYVDGDAVLNEALLQRYGTKLYVAGSLSLDAESEPLIGRLAYLKVHGSVQLPAELVPAFAAIQAEYGELIPIKGIILSDKVSFALDKALMERHPEGITFIDCVNVKLDKEIPPEWIEERLVFRDCVNVSCSPQQRSAVEMAGANVDENNLLGNLLDAPQQNDPGLQVVSAMEYRLL